jgi:phage I-like protein
MSVKEPQRPFCIEIQLSEPDASGVRKAPEWVDVLRVGRFKHPKYGRFSVTDSMLSGMVKNFDERVRGIDLAVDYFHRSDEEAAGWFQAVRLSGDRKTLQAKVDWTEEAAKKLSDKKIRYFSADYSDNYEDPETGTKHGPTLLGAALTNRPFIKGMAPAVELSEKEEEEMDIKELSAKLDQTNQTVATLADTVKKLAEGKGTEGKKEGEKPAESSKDEKQLSEVEKENAKLKADLEKVGKERDFDKMLSEGKAVEAQREAFLSGDMKQFAEKAVKVNTQATGNAGQGQAKDEPKTAAEAEDKILKLAEERAGKDKIELSEAIRITRRENPELVKKLSE